MSETVLWKANTRLHDWRDGLLFQQLLQQAIALGLASDVTWVKTSWEADKKPDSIPSTLDLPEKLMNLVPKDEEYIDFSAGGDDSSWEIYWSAYLFDTDEGMVEGINTLWLTFDRALVSDPSQSQALLNAFMDLHTPKNTEYAVIHPYQHWVDFADQHYETPVTITPMFKGVFWANFLGSGHLQEFDSDAIKGLTTVETIWLDSEGLFFVTAPTIQDSDKPKTEQEMLRLTDHFRTALSAASKWHF